MMIIYTNAYIDDQLWIHTLNIIELRMIDFLHDSSLLLALYMHYTDHDLNFVWTAVLLVAQVAMQTGVAWLSENPSL